MSVLVTGGAGYIGSHMVLELLANGEQPVVIDDLSAGFRWAVPAEVPFIEGDAGDGPLVGRVLREHKVGAIVHFAARIVVPDSGGFRSCLGTAAWPAASFSPGTGNWAEGGNAFSLPSAPDTAAGGRAGC